jgi:hypothetical protein
MFEEPPAVYRLDLEPKSEPPKALLLSQSASVASAYNIYHTLDSENSTNEKIYLAARRYTPLLSYRERFHCRVPLILADLVVDKADVLFLSYWLRRDEGIQGLQLLVLVMTPRPRALLREDILFCIVMHRSSYFPPCFHTSLSAKISSIAISHFTRPED